MESQPHIENKTIINSTGEITFDNTEIIPGFEGEKVLMVTYTYKNTTDNPMGAFDALLASGEFKQENADSIVTLSMGIPDTDWELSNENYQDMYNTGSSEKLKSGETKQYVDFIELDNSNNPVTFKAEDQDTRTSLGSIKLDLNK